MKRLVVATVVVAVLLAGAAYGVAFRRAAAERALEGRMIESTIAPAPPDPGLVPTEPPADLRPPATELRDA